VTLCLFRFAFPLEQEFLGSKVVQDWTFREAEVRLSEHRELRQALGLVRVPDFTTLYRFLQCLDDVTIDRAVGDGAPVAWHAQKSTAANSRGG
jgi:hypothetical protein